MNLKIFNTLLVGTIFALALTPQRGFSTGYFGVQGGYGKTTVKTQHPDEIDKSGSSKFGKLELGSRFGTKIGLDLGVGLGLNYADIKGSSDELQKRQAVAAAFPFMDLTAQLYVWPGLLVGGIVRNTYAMGATYGFADANKISYVLAAGPSAFLTLPLGSLNFQAGAIYLADINNPQRKVKSLYYSVGINYASKSSGNSPIGPK